MAGIDEVAAFPQLDGLGRLLSMTQAKDSGESGGTRIR